MAAAMPLVGPDVARVNRARSSQTTESWQRDAWYFFDAIGELRSPITFIANACSQATPFAAEVDADTQLITGPTEDDRVQRAAAQVLGGAAHRAQLLQTIAVCWQVPGELFVIIRPTPPVGGLPQPDKWLALSGQRVTEKGGSWTYIDPTTLLTTELGEQDRMVRVWSPHPNDQSKADTAVRPALPILREIEKSSMNIAAKLDSRLSSNGIWLFPQEADFPPGRNPDGSPMSQASSVASFVMESMTASMSNPGTAAAQAPIVVTMPGEWIEPASKSHMDLSTALDGQVVELRQDGISRLAVTLDMPKDVAAGTQAEANHWGAWQVEESTYKIYIEPLLQRIGDALTEYWFRPALVAMGVTDPERYVIDWDTSAIVKRPDATEDLNWLYDHELISDNYRREQSGIPNDAIPDDEELETRRLVDIVKGAPTLAADPTISAKLFGFEIAPAAAGVAGDEIDSSGEIVDGGSPAPRALPATQNDAPDGLTAAAELIVFDALSRVGGRLLTNQNRGQFKDTPRHELHTVIAAADVDGLLNGSFTNTDGVADAWGLDRALFRTRLLNYSRTLLTHGVPYSRGALGAVVWTMR
jgi:hypothetical protein